MLPIKNLYVKITLEKRSLMSTHYNMMPLKQFRNKPLIRLAYISYT